MHYSPQELMVAAAAGEIRDGEVVFAGMRLPLIAFALAKQTHAPRAIGLFECGLVRDTPAPELLYTMGDPPNVAGALLATRMVNILGLLAQGAVDMGFIGGAEIDRFGNLNTSYVQNRPVSPFSSAIETGLASAEGWQGHVSHGEDGVSAPPLTKGGQGGVPFMDLLKGGVTKLPGSGGAADIACLSNRLVIIMPHEKRRMVERVSYITSPGYGDGDAWRRREGLRRGGPSALITTRGIFRFDPEQGQAVLHSFHPGETIESVREDTGWTLTVAPDVYETPAPTGEELAIIRRYDPQGFWTGRKTG